MVKPMKKKESPILSAIAPLLSDRCVLLSEQHARALMARMTGAAKSDRLSFDLPSAAESQSAEVVTVACIPVVGVLTKYPLPPGYDAYFGFCPAVTLMQQLAAAMADPAVEAIIIDIDSPGGFVNGTVEFADAVAAANKTKPITAIVRGLCCSGAYWIASQCGKIVSRPESEVGNIGVYSVLADVTRLYESMGVSLTLVASGQFKGLGADGRVSDDLIADTRRINAGLFQQFVSAVAAGRDISLDRANELADGRAYLGPQAKAQGLIDEISTSFETAIQSVIGASAPKQESHMASANTPGAATVTAPKPTAAKSEEESSGGSETSKMLTATISSANAHRDQVRKAIDHCSASDEEMDDETKGLARKAVNAVKATNEEAGRCAKAWLARAGGDPKEEPTEDGGDGTDETKKSLKLFVDTFGGDFGAKAFTDKKPLAAATTEYVAKLKADHKAALDTLRAENTDLKTKLAAMPRGNDEAKASIPEGATTGSPKSKGTMGLTPGQAKLAGSMKLPTAASIAAAPTN